MRLWKVGFDVTVRHHDNVTVRHSRQLLVAAADDEQAEAMARAQVANFAFGKKVLAIEWRSTASMPNVFDLSEWVETVKERA